MNFATKELALTTHEEEVDIAKTIMLNQAINEMDELKQILDIEQIDLSLRVAEIGKQIPQLVSISRPEELYESIELHKLACERIRQAQSVRILKLTEACDSRSISLVDLISKSDAHVTTMSAILHENLCEIMNELRMEVLSIERELNDKRSEYRNSESGQISILLDTRRMYEESVFLKALIGLHETCNSSWATQVISQLHKPHSQESNSIAVDFERLKLLNMFRRDELKDKLISIHIKNKDHSRFDNQMKSRIVNLHEYRDKLEMRLKEYLHAFETTNKSLHSDISKLKKTLNYLQSPKDSKANRHFEKISASNRLEIQKLFDHIQQEKTTLPGSQSALSTMRGHLRMHLEQLELLDTYNEKKLRLMEEEKDLRLVLNTLT